VNPVESVVFLILTFFNAAIILFLFNSEFLGLLFIIIYVGAIAVLFLFVVMMLNVKMQENSVFYSDFFKTIYSLRFIFFYFVTLLIFLLLKQGFSNEDVFLQNNNFNFFETVDSLSNIDILGQILYNYFLVCFLISGLILLVALVGSIVLTLKFSNVRKGQLTSRQLSRTDNFLTFFK
jgi:NADH-quinone oxidoreductase subunit J